MPSKLDYEQLKQLMLYRRTHSVKESAEYFGISYSTVMRSNQRAINSGIITQKEIRTIGKIHRIESGEKIGSKNYVGNLAHPKKLRVWGSHGGGQVQKLHGEKIRKNLSSGKKRGYIREKFPYNFDSTHVEFDSKSELRFALFLLKSGLVQRIQPGINYQVPISYGDNGATSTIYIDFVVRTNTKKLAIEVHSKSLDNLLQEDYKERRRYQLDERNSKLNLVVIEKGGDYYPVFKMLRPNARDSDYLSAISSVKKLLEEYKPEDHHPEPEKTPVQKPAGLEELDDIPF